MMEFDSEKYNHFVKIYRNLAKVYIFLKKVKKTKKKDLRIITKDLSKILILDDKKKFFKKSKLKCNNY